MKKKNVRVWAVDLDGTLAHYGKFKSLTTIGRPVKKMVEFVKARLVDGDVVRIFTARLDNPEPLKQKAIRAIQAWSLKNIGIILDVTNVKTKDISDILDDRCWRVVKNKGIIICPEAKVHTSSCKTKK